MEVLFFLGHDGFVRNFERTLRLLVERGHHVTLAVTGRRPVLMTEVRSLDELVASSESLSLTRAPKGRDTRFAALETELYAARVCLRYLRPQFRGAPGLRERGYDRAPAWARRVADSRMLSTEPALDAIDWSLRRAIDVLPTSEQVDRFVHERRADIALFTPLIGFGSPQNSALRSVSAAGIPSVLLVHSWDNLSSKGVIHQHPDRVFVWNEAQAAEAVALHGVPRDRVIVTGAPSFDHWFGRRPATTAEEFARTTGLDPAAPFLMYACSSAFVGADEPAFIRTWVEALRGSGVPALEQVGILVRPHPQRLSGWEDADLDALPNVSVWPHQDADRAGPSARADYYDSLYHATGIVGINTTAFVEAAIVGTPTFTCLVDRHHRGQDGTLHFEHLRTGPLTVAPDMPTHLSELTRLLGGEDLDRGRSRRFVEAFVRPGGLDVAASELLVDAVERTAHAPLARRSPPSRAQLGLRYALAPWAYRTRARRA